MTTRRSPYSTLIICALYLLVGGFGVAIPASAQAQDDARTAEVPTAEALEKAEAHFAKGAQYFSEERYASAIVEFLSAYKYKPDPMLQYNISIAHARLGNIDEAYKAALRADAKSSQIPESAVPVNAARVHAWGSALQARALGEALASAHKTQAARGEELRGDIASIETPAVASNSGLSALGWSGVAASAVGVGLLGYATYVDRSMGDDIDAYQSSAGAPRPDDYHAYKDDLAQRQVIGLISLYSGVALTAVGLGMLSYDLFSDGGESAVMDVSAGSDGAAVRLTYLFK